MAAGVEIQAGDVVLVRTGWMRYWDDRAAYQGAESGLPGPDTSAAEWLVERRIRATGSDTDIYEVQTTHAGPIAVPAHTILLTRGGIHIMEMVNLEELARERVYEFLFVTAPLKIVGGTGSPIRPLAIA